MYLLDANIFIYFKDSNQLQALTAAAGQVPLIVAKDAYDEFTVRNNRGGLQVKAEIDKSPIEVRSIPLRKAQALAALRSGRITAGPASTEDLGEDASIILVSMDPNLLFVTNDYRAAFDALNELREPRGRVMTAHVFLREMVEQKALSLDAAKKVAAKMGRAPSWWATWS